MPFCRGQCGVMDSCRKSSRVGQGCLIASISSSRLLPARRVRRCRPHLHVAASICPSDVNDPWDIEAPWKTPRILRVRMRQAIGDEGAVGRPRRVEAERLNDHMKPRAVRMDERDALGRIERDPLAIGRPSRVIRFVPAVRRITLHDNRSAHFATEPVSGDIRQLPGGACGGIHDEELLKVAAAPIGLDRSGENDRLPIR